MRREVLWIARSSSVSDNRSCRKSSIYIYMYWASIWCNSKRYSMTISLYSRTLSIRIWGVYPWRSKDWHENTRKDLWLQITLQKKSYRSIWSSCFIIHTKWSRWSQWFNAKASRWRNHTKPKTNLEPKFDAKHNRMEECIWNYLWRRSIKYWIFKVSLGS